MVIKSYILLSSFETCEIRSLKRCVLLVALHIANVLNMREMQLHVHVQCGKKMCIVI